MPLLGEVDELKVDREGPRHAPRPLESKSIHLVDEAHQSVGGFGSPALSQFDRGRPQPLHVAEQLGTLVLHEHLPQRRAQPPDVSSKGTRRSVQLGIGRWAAHRVHGASSLIRPTNQPAFAGSVNPDMPLPSSRSQIGRPQSERCGPGDPPGRTIDDLRARLTRPDRGA